MELTRPLRLVLADDHVPTRAAVRAALEQDGCVVVADVADAPGAVTAARELRPDVCVLDLNMPGSGIAAAAQITAAFPETKVVMLTASRDDDDLYDAVRAGALGYLLKDTDPDRLGAALRAVLAGETVLPRGLLLRVIDELRPRQQRRRLRRTTARAAATERELQVLELLATGLRTVDVAARLEIDPAAVRGDLASSLAKLQTVTDNGRPAGWSA